MQGFERDIEEQIVALLKTHLSLSFTLFQFSELAGRELLDLLNTVIHAIDETQPEKIGTEKIEATVERMSEFLRILKYEFPVAPEEWDVRLSNADKALIHPALLFLLRDMEDMKKRAYLARYMEEVQIPEEIRVDPTVTEMLQQHRELREQFEQVHTELESLGTTNVDTLKASIQDLESDKARLATRIAAFKRKMANVKNLEELLKWTAKVRQESEREMKLADQLQKLSDEKRLLMHRQQVASDRIRNMRTHMEQRLQSLRHELETLKTSGANASPDEKSLIFSQQQVVAQNKRLEQKQKQLEDLRQQRAAAEQELQEKQKDGVIQMPTQSQFKQYVANLRNVADNYKNIKAGLDEVKRDLVISRRTEDIVRSQEEVVRRNIEKIERQRGVSGFREARRELEQVSATKADLDDVKGKTLEEMSAIVKDIQRNIQARQNELRPLVAQLQEQRKQKAVIESKYLQAKQRYTNAVNEYESVCMELVEESKKLRTEIATYQSKFHSVSHLLAGLERTLKRSREEQKAQETANPVSKQIKTYSDHFSKSSRAMRKETKELKEQKKSLGTQSEVNQKQLEGFQSLRRLLQVKALCQKAAQIRKEKEKQRDQMESHIEGEMIDFTKQDDA